MFRRVVVALGLALALAPLCGAPAAAVTPTPSPAPTCLVPFVFVPLTVANANQVNSNFSALATCIDSVLSGAGYPTLQCTGLVTCSPNAGATPGVGVAAPTATSTSTAGPPSCSWSSFQLQCFFPIAGSSQATPSPSATSTTTAGPPSFVISGSFPYAYTVNFPAAGTCANCVILQSAPSPSPQGGYVALTGTQLWDNPSSSLTGLYIGPNPVPSAQYYPDAIMVGNGAGSGACGNSYRTAWGTNGVTILGISGGLFSLSCTSTAGGPYLNVDTIGDLAINGTFYPNNKGNALAIYLNQGAIGIANASSTVNDCWIVGNAGWGGLQVVHNGGGTCSVALTDIAPSTTLCTSTSATHELISNCAEGQVVCAVVSGGNCSATASPIPTGRTCIATYDSTATTVSPAPNDLLPVMTHVSGAVLTITMGVTATPSGNLAADYHC